MINARAYLKFIPSLNRCSERMNTIQQNRRCQLKFYHTNKTYVPLLDEIKKRKNEAKRSIIVQVKGKESWQDLYSFCSSNIGQVSGMYYFKNKISKSFSDYYIVEFQDDNCVERVLETSLHISSDVASGNIPVTSPFLWLASKSSNSPPDTNRTLDVVSASVTINQDDDILSTKVDQDLNFSDQILHYAQAKQLPESHIRVRYMLCRQIELLLQGIFHHSSVIPFGSSVNGFGDIHGDQDMILSLTKLDFLAEPDDSELERRLVFHTKSTTFYRDRALILRYCDQISDLISAFLPGVKDVQKVLTARVPIIKYRQELVGMDCDISMSNTGLFMSSLLHLFSGVDYRVHPLVSYVKFWAKSERLVKDARPTLYFTNFTIIMMVVCYLQQVHGMLPAVATLNDLGTDKDRFVSEDGVVVNFLQDVAPHLSKLNACLTSEIDLFELLLGFFHFYGEFNFETHRLNPITGKTEVKDRNWSKSRSLDIINPIEPDLNISYNVSPTALKQFKDKCRESKKRYQAQNSKLQQSLIIDVQKTQKSTSLIFPTILDLKENLEDPSDSTNINRSLNKKSNGKRSIRTSR